MRIQKNAGQKDTLSSKLRSLSIQQKLNKQSEFETANSNKIASTYGADQKSKIKPSWRFDDSESRAYDFAPVQALENSETRKYTSTTM